MPDNVVNKVDKALVPSVTSQCYGLWNSVLECAESEESRQQRGDDGFLCAVTGDGSLSVFMAVVPHRLQCCSGEDKKPQQIHSIIQK